MNEQRLTRTPLTPTHRVAALQDGWLPEPWVIEELERERERSEIERPGLHIPAVPPQEELPMPQEERQPSRGVVIIDL